MKTRLVAAVAALFLGPIGGTASAGLVTMQSSVGIENGFGVNAESGQTFDSFPLEDDPPITSIGGPDQWRIGVDVQHVYSLPNDIVSARLTLFSGGWGTYGRARVWVNDTLIAEPLTLGEVDGENFAWRDDGFELPNAATLLTGSDTVKIRPVTGGELDFGVLDYSLLSITYRNSGTTAVPEPTTFALTALALAGLAASRRRQAR